MSLSEAPRPPVVPARIDRPLAGRAAAIAALGVLALSAALVLQRVGGADVCIGAEAVEGLAVRRMVENGELLFPRTSGAGLMYKPPLFHWTSLAIHRALGATAVSAGSLRLASGAHAVAGVGLAMLLARTFLGADAAILAGLVLATSAQYVAEGRYGRVDMALAFWEWAALCLFAWWWRRRRADGAPSPRGDGVGRILHLALAAALGAAVLAKGPVGALLPAAAIGVFLFAVGGRRELAALLRPGPLLLGFAVASSFYLACALTGRFDLLAKQLAWENVDRFAGGIDAMKWWYYLQPLLLNSVPTSLVVPLAVAAALVPVARAARPARRGVGGAPSPSGSPAVGDADGLAALLAIFWVVTVLFFSVAAYKRRAYLLPLWPPAAVLLAWWIDRMGDRRAAGRRMLLGGCALLAIADAVALPILEHRRCAAAPYRLVAEDVERALRPGEPVWSAWLDDEGFAPMRFYIERPVPLFDAGPMFEVGPGAAPPGAILVPIDYPDRGPDLPPGYRADLLSRHGPLGVALLRRTE